MKAFLTGDRSSLPTLLVSLATASVTFAQREPPHIGYVYPAGGQQGTEFTLLIGGTELSGTTAVRFSGAGVRAEKTDYLKPLNQGAFGAMRNRMQEKLEKKEAAAPGATRNPRRLLFQSFTNEAWTAEDEAGLVEMRERMSTFPVGLASVPALFETVELRVTVAADAEPGERELRLQTQFGLSNPLKFNVGQLPEVTGESGRHAVQRMVESRDRRKMRPEKGAERPAPGTAPIDTGPEEDTEVTLPVVVNGQILPGDADRYTFKASKGQDLIVDVYARKLMPYLSDAVPGWFQATVTLFDSDGREVAYDDDFRFHPDPVLHYRVPADGRYVLEIRDAIHRGREDFVYRIAVGELPYLTGVFPLGCRVGRETEVELLGWNLPKTRVTQRVGKAGVCPVVVRRGKQVSNPVPFAVDTLPECFDTEPNNVQECAQRVTLPVIANGRIDRPGDMDVFCFKGRAGTRIEAEIHARRLGSSLDSILRLATASGKELALNDDYEDRAAALTTHHADSRVCVALPSDGLYYLFVCDTQQKGGVDCGYRLHITEQRSDFELRVVPSSLTVRPGTSVPITVHALRADGFDGEIAVALKDAPYGFRLSGGRVPAGESAVRMTLTVVGSPAETPYSLCLEGRATVRGREIVHDAVPADDVMQAFIYRHLVPAEALQVAVIGKPRRFAMGVSSSGLARIPAGGTSRVRVRVPERSFLGTTELELSDPPDGITIEDVSLGGMDGELVLRGDAAAEPGQQGNLIVNVFARRPEREGSKGKGPRQKDRILMSALPAIPFEVVGK